MEVSTTGISGGPQPSPLPPPSLTAVNDAHDEGQDDLVHNKIVSDCPMEDRGVDLSFDTTAVPVKKELENVSDNNNPSSNSSDLLPSPRIHPAALKVKEEYKEFSDIKPQCQSPSLLTSSPGGRLKIFQNGQLLIELRGDADGGKWVSAPSNKVYWPPRGPSGPPGPHPVHHNSRLDSNASQHTNTGSESSAETSSLHSQHSPWHQSLPSPRPSPGLPAETGSTWPAPAPHRVKPVPKKLVNPPPELLFAMKPPQGVRNYRKKIRPFRRKCRNPASEIKVGLFLLRLECNAAGAAVQKPRRSRLDPKVRAARLADLVSKITSLRNRVHVPIQAWKTGRTDLNNLTKGSPVVGHHVTPSGGIRVKSELKLVTETCTATITSVTTSPRVSNKVKAETRIVTAETRPVPVKSLPITPTIGRVKQELTGDRGFKLSATAIMSPELARVKMEIGRDTHNYLGGLRDDRDGGFVSPRKRLIRDNRDFDNGSPSAKHRRMSSEHRLSTDSLGSTSDRSSPYRAPHSPHRSAMSPAPAVLGGGAMSPKPKVSFSIDSIMGGGAGPTMPSRPHALTPSKHPPLSHLRSPAMPVMPVQPTPTRPRPPVSPPRSPTPSSRDLTAPGTPFSPYLGYPGVHPLLGQDARLLDPRIAQLAGLAAGAQQLATAADPRVSQLAAAADPRLTPGSAYPSPAYLLHNYMAAAAAQAAAASSPLSGLFAANSLAAATQAVQQQAAASQAAQQQAAATQAAQQQQAAAASQSGVWTPPVVTTAVTTPSPTPPPPHIPPPRQFAGESPTPSSLPPPSSRPSEFLRHPSVPTSTTSSSKAPDIKYRGEPARFSKLFGDTDDTPLNLSMKPTTL